MDRWCNYRESEESIDEAGLEVLNSNIVRGCELLSPYEHAIDPQSIEDAFLDSLPYCPFTLKRKLAPALGPSMVAKQVQVNDGETRLPSEGP